MMFAASSRPRIILSIAIALVVAASGFNATGQSLSGKQSVGAHGVKKTTAEIMANPQAREKSKHRFKKEREIPGRKKRPQNPFAPAKSHWPAANVVAPKAALVVEAPQTTGTNFTGATLAETGAFPPDSMGAVGPSQFVVFVNGRLKTFNKATGVADGILNVDPDIFFSSVMTPTSPPGLNFTSDPQVRYDRLSARWILQIIDVPSTSSSSIGDLPNRVLIAVSDAASAGVITGNTVWSFFFVQQNTVGGGNTGEFLDYDSLGVDNNALYIGGNMFGAASGSFVNTSGFVVRKSSILNGGPIVVTAFRNLITAGGGSDGPDSPRGVDNNDSAANEGYFIGPSDATFGRLILRRVSDPGGTPAISTNISITVTTTGSPVRVDHLGNTGSTSWRLDALDERLFAAQIRSGKLWTAHTIGVNGSGVASTSRVRNAVRWYELNVPAGSGTPTVVQSGTVFDSATNASAARNYWMPSVAVSGQGHAALGFSTAGTSFRIDAATNGRLVSDPLGTLGTPTFYTASSTAYNPPDDPGGSDGRRWGDYSFTSVDPQDDMTMWTVQEFCDGTNSYGARAVKLLAPPPATPVGCSPNIADHGTVNLNMVVTGSSTSGSGFFDPGSAFPHRLGAVVSGTGVNVNSLSYTDPTHITLDISVAPDAPLGQRTITVTNPDGQIASSATGILAINSQANLQITETGAPNPVAAGYHLTYHLMVTNNGPDTATNVSVVETLPAAVSFVSSMPAPISQSGIQLTYQLGPLVSGQSVPIDIKVAVPPSTTGPLSAAGNVTSDLDDLNSKDNSATAMTDVLADTDHDGIPDAWENANGLNPSDPADADLDNDGDGFSNLEEYVAGTNPNDPASIWEATA
ncbi:MAG TPA: hypothetical protein VGM62_20055, partial [Chthoniobacterales bacterium]